MKTSGLHSSEAPEARDEPGLDAYEPPSLTELGSFLELTAGGGQAGTDVNLGSVTN